MNATVKKVLIVFAKNAVNATLVSLAPVYHSPQAYNLHTWHGIVGVLEIVVGAVLVREGLIFIPKIYKWSQTNASLDDDNGNSKGASAGGQP